MAESTATKQTFTTNIVEVREAVNRLKETMFTFGFSKNDSEEVMLIEYLKNLRKSEQRRQLYSSRSPQLEHRKDMVDKMVEVGSLENLCCESVYLAIYLFDRFMDTHHIPRNILGHIALACIVISGKMLECENTVKYKKLKKYIPRQGLEDDRVKKLIKLEMMVLSEFEYDVLVPTEANYLYVYLLYSVDGMNAYQANNNVDSEPNANYTDNPCPDVPATPKSGSKKVEAIHDVAFCALEVLACEAPVTNIQPSLVAAAVLLAARRENSLNFWTPTLSRVTSYEFEEVCECLSTYVEENVGGMEWARPFNKPEFYDFPSAHCQEFVEAVKAKVD